ncbi:MAG: HNH endonuclease [Gammaproteobacteria bacterium]|nr:HNH endonuclease [Gammaproteobacteria bacterium]
MKFGESQKVKFDSESGAYSIVTQRENYDSQITITDAESDLLLVFFGQTNIQIGNVKSNPAKAKKRFKHYPDGKNIDLNLVYPKPEKAELRLYISARAGFKPEAGDVWFLFEKQGVMWIGSMSEAIWRSENQILIYDQSEAEYQDGLQALDEVKITKLKARDQFTRDRRKALRRMEQSNYQCEYDTSHRLFVSHSTKKPYLEAHHLIPMSMQKKVSTSLDTLSNIYCLCPHCHRAIHHAEKPKVKKIIGRLISNRSEVLDLLGNSVEDIYCYYAVEEIVR